MPSKRRITAGQVRDIEDIRNNPALLEDWIFVDIGFSSTRTSCGIAIGSCAATEVTFADLVKMVVDAVEKQDCSDKPLHLVLEAPLSMAFTEDGNPWPRTFEGLIDGIPRGWYYQAGATTRGGAERLMWKLRRCKRRRPIRLFEGFIPRERGAEHQAGDHARVAEQLRGVVKGETGCPIVRPDEITAGLQVWPISGIEGWDSNKPPKDNMIPPVVWVPQACLGEHPENISRQCPCTALRNQVP